MKQDGINLMTNSSCKPLLTGEKCDHRCFELDCRGFSPSIQFVMEINYPFKSVLHMLGHPCGAQSFHNTTKNVISLPNVMLLVYTQRGDDFRTGCSLMLFNQRIQSDERQKIS